MTVYVDDARIPATVGRIRGRWPNMTADTPEELHAFAARLGCQRSWYQETCKRGRCAPEGQPCPHWHYDLTDSKRRQAITAGAQPIDLRAMGELIRARRAANAAGAQS